MKTLSAAISAELAKKTGIEPVTVVAVQWSEDGDYIQYSDQQYPEEPSLLGQLLDISTLESVVKLDQSGQSQSITMTLSDIDGSIKDIIDFNNVHGRTVNVYQWVRGLPLSEKFLLYQGEINGPIDWNGGDRTVTFDVITKLADREVGFSAEQGVLADVPSDLAGKPWPIVFGICQNVPALALHEHVRSSAVTDVFAPDPSIISKLWDLIAAKQWTEYAFMYWVYALLQVEFSIDFALMLNHRGLRDSIQATVNQLAWNYAQIQNDIIALQAEYAAQQAQVPSSIEIANGNQYPQGQVISIVVENTNGSDIRLSGYFDGDTFNIQDSHPTAWTVSQYNSLTPYGYTFIRSGASIRLDVDTNGLYIANLNRSDVKMVRAERGTGPGKALAVVPTDLYSVEYIDLGVFEVTAIRIPTALSDIDSEWGNDIWVTQEDEDIGPNTVDIIEWIIDTFTDLEKDATSFATVRAQLENYPSHFALLDQWNVLELLESILFQARTAGYVVNNTVYLKYLAQEDTPSTTIEDSDVKAGTIRMLSTPTEDLVTKLVAEWTDDYAIETPHKYVLRNNIPIYGMRERTVDFFIYNMPELVLKSATFWIIRLSNVWKRARFRTYLNKMATETFDTLSVNLTGDFFLTGTVNGLVTELSYESGADEVEFECWLPVKFGTMEEYIFAWPSDKAIEEFYPQANEWPTCGSTSPQKDVEGELTFGGGGDGIKITYGPSRDAVLARRYEIRSPDQGEVTPSDLDDTKPTPAFGGSILETGTAGSYNSDYGYNDYDVSEPTMDLDQLTCFPAEVTGGGTASYNLDVYVNGLDNTDDVKQVLARQMQHDGVSVIPAGSMCIAIRNPIRDEDGEILRWEWTMQIPVWL